MSTELKLLRAIVSMDAEATNDNAANLATLKATADVSAMEFRELLTKLYRKGYLTTDWQATPAGRRVAGQALGKVLLRRQPRGRQAERGSNTKTKPRKTFPSAQPKMPPPLLNSSLNEARARRNGPPTLRPSLPRQMYEGQQRTPPPLPSHPAKDNGESFVAVRDSELEELKPRR